jgi:NAD-dependent dihydropyrimidine dehydrogenase PreA subunit
MRSNLSMAYVVTDACTKDFVCVAECSTAAIAPMQSDPAAATVSQVYINPDECIDCGNCASICAQSAIYSEGELPAEKADFAAKNKAYFN